MNTTIHLPLLDQIQIASPCPERWEDMTGDDRVRLCAQCDLHVHNISAMTRDEAETVLARLSEGRICARFFRRTDGTILTRDCPVGIARARASLLKAVGRIAAAVGLAALAATAARAAQDKSWGNYGWSIRLAHSRPVAWATCQLASLWPSRSCGQWLGGVVAGPPGNPPQIINESGGNWGPHAWEYRE